MGKRKKPFNENKFIKKVCRNCTVCGIGGAPVFCFDWSYKNNPSQFMSLMFSRLKDVPEWEYLTSTDRDAEEDLFKYIFCRGGCKSLTIKPSKPYVCIYLSACITHFRKQITESFKVESEYRNRIHYRKKKNKRKKRKDRKKKRNPYPTFMSSESDNFKGFIRRIFGEDKTEEQDRDKGVPESAV